MLSPDYPVSTERLRLRPITQADARTIHGYKSRPDVVAYVSYDPMSLQHIRSLIDGAWSRTEITDEGQALRLGVEESASGRLLGEVVLRFRDAANRCGEIGYVFDPAARGQGYATEAAGALLQLGFDGLNLHRITATLDARNSSSARVLERLGMRLEARHVQAQRAGSAWVDKLEYALLESEWRALR